MRSQLHLSNKYAIMNKYFISGTNKITVKNPKMKTSVIDNDITEILSADLPWDDLSGKTIAITGANGMLAAYLVDTLLCLENKPRQVIALVRSPEKANVRFAAHRGDRNFRIQNWSYEETDLNLPDCNILIHAASIPRPDSETPVDVIGPNEIGTWNLLQYVRRLPRFEQFVFFSSGAVYGDRFSNDTPVSEEQFFPVDQMNPASCYAESKRAGENICVSFMRQYKIPVKIVRYAHTFGPGMDLEHDPRSFVSFVRAAKDGENIRLTGTGCATRYFCYVTDATIALFTIILKGRTGEAYNISNPQNAITIRELAETIVSLVPEKDLKVIPNGTSGPKGYAPQQFAPCPSNAKVSSFGWSPRISIQEGFQRILKSLQV